MPLKTHHDEMPNLNLTSLIDVVFLLIVFFMAASKFTDPSATSTSRLPEVAKGDVAVASPRRPARWRCTPTGASTLDSEAVTLDELDDAARRSDHRRRRSRASSSSATRAARSSTSPRRWPPARRRASPNWPSASSRRRRRERRRKAVSAWPPRLLRCRWPGFPASRRGSSSGRPRRCDRRARRAAAHALARGEAVEEVRPAVAVGPRAAGVPGDERAHRRRGGPGIGPGDGGPIRVAVDRRRRRRDWKRSPSTRRDGEPDAEPAPSSRRRAEAA